MGKGSRVRPGRAGTHSALRLRDALSSAAQSRSIVTYGWIMKRFGLSRGKALSLAIAEVDRMEYVRGAPGFAAIVVRKDTGFPGGGYFVDDSLPPGVRRPKEKSSDPRLNAAEKEYVASRQRAIWGYYADGGPRSERPPSRRPGAR